jgi:hypothetical protein
MVMSAKEFIREHKSLVKILKTGSKAKRLAEARKQKRELDSKK